ncbi:NTPase [Balamuthia mandrillaris]
MAASTPKRIVLLTGPPGVGKTTAVETFVSKWQQRSPSSPSSGCFGFVTKEIRKQQGRGCGREGFKIETLHHKQTVVLAHENIRSSKHRVGKYGVDVDALDHAVLPELSVAAIAAAGSGEQQGRKEPTLIVIDEIGKMECFSRQFCSLVEQLVEHVAEPANHCFMVGTIALRTTIPFIEGLKRRDGDALELWHVSRENRQQVPARLLAYFHPDT